jgi:type VI secretion system secreted protein Hcp
MAGAVFLKMEGIEGDSTDDLHENEIDVLAWSWGLLRSGTQEVGGRTTAGRVSGQEMSITKYLDKSSPVLVKHVCNGQAIKNAVLTVQTSGGEDEKVNPLVIEMEDVVVTSYQPSGTGDAGAEIPTEGLTLSCKRFTYKYTGQKADSHADAESEQTWDFDKNNVM